MANSTSPDESWDELARELGLERPSSPPADAASLDEVRDEDLPPQEDPEEAPIEEERPARGHPWAAEEAESGEPAEEEFEAGEVEFEGIAAEGEAGEEGAAEEGQPGTGRKRRRRRRRRKKGGPAAAPAEAEAAEGEEFAVTARVAGEEIVEAEAEEIEEEEGMEEVATGEDEEVGGEVLRDLIANWNVPSWDEIVTGLYRPER